LTGGLHHLTIAEGARLIGEGELSPVTWTERLLERIDAVDPLLDAFITVTGSRALSQARRAEKEIQNGQRRGLLHGVPFALKDVIDTAGIRTTASSKVCADRVPGRDAAVVRRIEAAGAIILGKLTTHEFAQGGPSFDLPWPPARNPWDRRRFTGSTSSGAGAAVAAGLTPAALGTDQGGSVRHPAAHCGLVGLKPTNGLVSRVGAIPNSYSFDCVGPMTWTVEDCAIVLQAIAGYDPEDPASADVTIPDYRAALSGDVRGMTVGLVRHFHASDVATDAEVKAGVERGAEVLGRLGAEVREVRLPPPGGLRRLPVDHHLCRAQRRPRRRPAPSPGGFWREYPLSPGVRGDDWRRRLRPGPAPAPRPDPPHRRGVRRRRRAVDGDRPGPGAVDRGYAIGRDLQLPGRHEHGVQRRRWSGRRRLLRVQRGRPAAFDADRRAALR
jgi:Asp-tRNA(Asn)/Glu-tRNA(Gln) amidotransferase A subunit family amidase